MPEAISPHQIICEGKADEVFFRRLLQASGKAVHVACPKPDVDGASGKSAIRRRLIGLQAQFDTLTRVVLLVDSDDDPAQALTDAKEELNQANLANPAKQYPVPTTVNLLAGTGALQTAIVLVPTSATKGCLDTLLLPSFEQRYTGVPLACVNDFCRCVRDPHRGETKDSK